MDTKKFFMLFMIMFMLFAVSGCGGSGGNTQNFSNDPISPDKPAPAPETKSDDIPLIPVPAPQSQDKPISTEPIPTPTNPIISSDPIPARYTVSFNSNGGSTVSSITVQSGHTINKPSNPKKYGCTFKGWYKDNALTQIFTFGADGDKVTANITLYAKWIEDSVLAEVAVEKVSIGYQDGDSANHVTKNITLPRNIDVSGDVANIIWSSNNEKVIYTNGTVTRQSTDVTVVLTALSSIGTADKSRVFTLKVIHAETTVPSSYTVSFNSNGGSSVSNITVSSGNTVNKPKDPSKNGYTFGGWYKDSTLTQAFRFGSGGDKITGDITLYAKWIETDRLRAEVAIEKISIGYQDSDSANSVTKNLTLPTLVYVSGDVNVSWSSNAPSVISNSGIVTRPSDNDVVVSLTAKVTVGSEARNKTFTVTVIHKETPAPLGYTVSFDTNGGSTVASIRVVSGGTVEMPENPTLVGYVFAGWYKDETFTEMFIFGSDGDKITRNTTLYAQWFDADFLVAEYALSEIVIIYANGDNPKYVTQNLTLPTKAGSADILWSSSSGAVSANGIVTRQTEDVDVTLTARASYNSKSSEPRTFGVKVIRKRTRDNRVIAAVSLEEASSGDIEVTRNTSGDVTDIEGQYVSFDIRNADDALDAVTVIKNELGVKSPDSELQLNGATINEYGAKYSFGQFYNGLKVWGRRIIVSANSSNKANFLNSNFMSSTAFDNANLNAGISQSRAEEIAKENYSDDVEYTAREVIYSFGKYENAPARVWIITISGTQKDGRYTDETIFIKSSDGTIISKPNNIMNMISNYGVNELNQIVQFPVTYEHSPLELQGFNYMLDTDLNIEVFYGGLPGRLISFNRVRLELNKLWTDGHQVSAYTNVRRVIQLWKQKFGRNSFDGKGMKIKIITHNNQFLNNDGTIMKDNAAWSNTKEVIVACDRENEMCAHSYAAALDVLAHESTHAVVHYGIGDEFSISGDIVAKAINEAYADIFACIMTEDESWKMGEDIFDENSDFDCIRDVANPTSAKAKSRFSHEWDAYKGALDNNFHIYEEHVFSHYISHAAYLMYKNGLSWEELRKLWYQTIHENVYTPFPKFSDVRHEVVRSAKTIPSLKSKVAIIENAFDEVGIYEPVTLSGKIIYAETLAPIPDISISALTLSETYGYIADDDETDANGNFSLQLSKTRYNLETGYTFEAENGEDFVNFVLPIELSRDKVITIVLARDGTASIDVLIPDVPTPTSPDIPAPISPDVPIASGDVPIDEAHFPDEVFREFVSKQDSNKDGVLNKEEAKNVTQIHFNYAKDWLSSKRVKSLKGIEYFTALSILTCTWAELTSLDVSKNKALHRLDCSGNIILNALNVSGCSELEYLDCSSNMLTSLDVSSCVALDTLDCELNRLITLNVSGCTALTWLKCNRNQLTKLDVTHNTALSYLDCFSNQLTNLDVTHNIVLGMLDCEDNQLTTLDVSKCTELSELYCRFNQLTVLDVSNCWKPHLLIFYDKGVEVIRSSTTTTNSVQTVSSLGASVSTIDDTEILAVLPAFTPSTSGTYSFAVSLDRTPPESTSLLLLSDSEDIHGSFTLTESPDTVIVSADFTAGRTYAPVIVAMSEGENQGGGCNAGNIGIILLAGFIVALTKGHDTEGEK